MKVDYWKIIDKYFIDKWAHTVYVTHVSLVTSKALKIAQELKLTKKQLRFIEEASMLHDIGIVKVNAPDIGCGGKLDYICHIIEGRKILEKEGLNKHALVCERHIGVGIPVTQIEEHNLPLPKRDIFPETLEEKIISWADLFYSKNPDKLLYEKSEKEVYENVKKYGKEYIDKFKEMQSKFSQ